MRFLPSFSFCTPTATQELHLPRWSMYEWMYLLACNTTFLCVSAVQHVLIMLGSFPVRGFRRHSEYFFQFTRQWKRWSDEESFFIHEERTRKRMRLLMKLHLFRIFSFVMRISPRKVDKCTNVPFPWVLVSIVWKERVMILVLPAVYPFEWRRIRLLRISTKIAFVWNHSLLAGEYDWDN